MGTRVEITLKDGTTKVYEGDQVVSMNITEANDPLCLKLEGGQMECLIYSPTDDFNILNPNGITSLLKTKQKVVAQYVEGETTTQIGTYYVDNWSLEPNNQLRLICGDGISLLDDAYYYREDFEHVDWAGHTYILRPIGTLFYKSGIIANSRAITRKGSIPSQIEAGLLIECMYPKLGSNRELVANICAQHSCSIIMKPDGTPYFFQSDETPDGGVMPRPESNNIIRKNRIVFATSSYEIPTKIGQCYVDNYTGYEKGSLEDIYSVSVSSGEGIIRKDLDDNFTDYQFTNARYTYKARAYIAFDYSVSTTTTISVKGKRIKNIYITRTKTFSNEEKASVVEIRDTLGTDGMPIDLWFNRWNNGFICTIDFLIEDLTIERAGTKVKVELEENKIYTGVIMELNIDVTGGNIGTAKILFMKDYEVINE